MARDRLKWYKRQTEMARDRPKWQETDRNGTRRTKMDQNGPKQTEMVPDRLKKNMQKDFTETDGERD